MVAFLRLVVATQHTITAIMMNKMTRSNSPITAPAMAPLRLLLPSPVVLTKLVGVVDSVW